MDLREIEARAIEVPYIGRQGKALLDIHTIRIGIGNIQAFYAAVLCILMEQRLKINT